MGVLQNVFAEDSPEEMYGGVGSLQEARQEAYNVTPETIDSAKALTLLPIFITVFGTISAIVKERIYAGEAIFATVWGIILSPSVSNLFHPREWTTDGNFNDMTLVIFRIVIAISVFAVGVELPKAYMLHHWKSLALLLGPNMICGWLISASFMFIIFPTLGFLHCMVIAAALSPTDPILAASVVGKGRYAQKHVPSHIRHILQSESGCNDGAAFPFLYLALYLLLRGSTSVGSIIGKWIYLVLLYQILLGTFIGAVVGVLARKALKFSKRHQMIDRESMVAMYVSLAVFTTGITNLAGSDDLLAAFACGAAFAWDDWFTESIEDSNFSNIVDLLINCTTFIYIGATMPFDDWNSEVLKITPWRLVVLAIAILFLRRLPAIILLYKFIPDITTFQEALFCGHFGPMGVGAIFIGTLAQQRLPTPTVPPETQMDYLSLSIQPIVYFLVLSSILVHGISIPFFSLGKRVHTISRTWTRDTGVGEPSWLHRVKRVDENNVDDILGLPPMETHSPVDDSELREKSSSVEDVSVRTLGGKSTEEKPGHENEEASGSASGSDVRVWPEGSKYVIERDHGENVDVIDPEKLPRRKPTSKQSAFINPPIPSPHNGSAADLAAESPSSSISQTQFPVSRPSALRSTNSLHVRPPSPPGAALSAVASYPKPSRRPSQFWNWGEPDYESMTAEEIERDKACRKERRDNDTVPIKRWVQGSQMIIERKNGEVIEIVDLDENELGKRRESTFQQAINKLTDFPIARKRSRSVAAPGGSVTGTNLWRKFHPFEGGTSFSLHRPTGQETLHEEDEEGQQSRSQSTSQPTKSSQQIYQLQPGTSSKQAEMMDRRQSREVHTESRTFRDPHTSPSPNINDVPAHSSTSALVSAQKTIVPPEHEYHHTLRAAQSLGEASENIIHHDLAASSTSTISSSSGSLIARPASLHAPPRKGRSIQSLSQQSARHQNSSNTPSSTFPIAVGEVTGEGEVEEGVRTGRSAHSFGEISRSDRTRSVHSQKSPSSSNISLPGTSTTPGDQQSQQVTFDIPASKKKSA